MNSIRSTHKQKTPLCGLTFGKGDRSYGNFILNPESMHFTRSLSQNITGDNENTSITQTNCQVTQTLRNRQAGGLRKSMRRKLKEKEREREQVYDDMAVEVEIEVKV